MTRELEIVSDTSSLCEKKIFMKETSSVLSTEANRDIVLFRPQTPGGAFKTSSIISRTSSSSPINASLETLQDSLERLPLSSLSSLCQRLRVQIIQQQLPQMCAVCQPIMLRSAQQTEVNLTLMLRSLCASCKSLFTTRNNSQEGLNGQLDDFCGVSDEDSAPLKKIRICSAGIRSGSPSKINRFSVSALQEQSSLSPSILRRQDGPIITCMTSSKKRSISRVILKVPLGNNSNSPSNGDSFPSNDSSKKRKPSSRKRPSRSKKNKPKPLLSHLDLPIYAALTEAGLDWCRLCGWFSDAGQVSMFSASDKANRSCESFQSLSCSSTDSQNVNRETKKEDVDPSSPPSPVSSGDDCSLISNCDSSLKNNTPILNSETKLDCSPKDACKSKTGHDLVPKDFWQEGPWGLRSFCAKHVIPPSLSSALSGGSVPGGRVPERIRPILQDYCATCKHPVLQTGSVFAEKGRRVIPHSVMCFGCPRAHHLTCLQCFLPPSTLAKVAAGPRWFCSPVCVRRHGAAVSAAAEYQERMLLVASSEGDEPGGCSVNNSTERRSVALSSDSEDCTGRVLGRKVISKIRSEPQSSVHTGRRYAKVLIAPPHTPPPSSPISKSGRGRGKDFSAKSGKANGRKRKRRSLNGTSGGSSVEPDILICFDSSAVGIRRFSLKKKALDDNVQQVEVFTPSFRPILVFPPVMPNFCRVIADSRASSPSANSSHVSDTGGGYSFIDDEEFHLIEEDVMSRRHLRYESVEKTMRLCRPEVLKSLQTSAAIDLGVSESDSGTDIPTKPLVEALNVPSKFSLDESPKCAAPMHPKVVTMAAPNSTHTLVP